MCRLSGINEKERGAGRRERGRGGERQGKEVRRETGREEREGGGEGGEEGRGGREGGLIQRNLPTHNPLSLYIHSRGKGDALKTFCSAAVSRPEEHYFLFSHAHF